MKVIIFVILFKMEKNEREKKLQSNYQNLINEIENIVEKTTKELKDTRFSMKTFEKLCSEYVPYNETEEDLIKAFKFWDKENTGKVSVEDLKESLTKIGDVLNNNQMESLIKEADPNETGTIDYYEYAKILIKKL